MKVTYIVPVYNENKTVRMLIEKLKGLPIEKEIVVVDDGSTDGSGQIIAGITGIKTITHQINKGKGASIIDGLKETQGDIVVIQDADLELDPEETLRLLKEIKDVKSDVVFGTRFDRDSLSLSLGLVCNILLAKCFNMIFHTNLTDIMTCYKIMHSSIIRSLDLKSDRFEIEVEIATKLLLAGYRIRELPISYKKRSKREGKKIRFKDSLKIAQVFWGTLVGAKIQRFLFGRTT